MYFSLPYTGNGVVWLTWQSWECQSPVSTTKTKRWWSALTQYIRVSATLELITMTLIHKLLCVIQENSIHHQLPRMQIRTSVYWIMNLHRLSGQVCLMLSCHIMDLAEDFCLFSDGVPSDGIPVAANSTIHFAVLYLGITYTIIGFIFSIAFLIFNIAYRNHP